MAQNNTQGTLSSMIPQGTPAAPVQTPPSFGAKLLGNKEFSVELNDAVFETEAWRGSRYNGHQLEAVEINKFNKGDKTYAKTPVIERYSRNIYIGNRIIGFEDDPIDDDPSPGFMKKSYISFKGYFTMNSDDTVTEVSVNFNNINERKGFERSFREDFNIGTKASLILIDKGVNHNLKNNYTVDFNEGLLSRILEISSSQTDNNADVRTTIRAVEDITPETGKSAFTVILTPPYTFDTPTYDTQKYIVYNNNESLYFTNTSGSGITTTSQLAENNRGNSLLYDFLASSRTNHLLDPSANKFFLEFKSPKDQSPSSFNQTPIGLQSVNTVELDFNNSDFLFDEDGSAFSIRLKNKPFNILSNPFSLNTFAGDNIVEKIHFDSSYSFVESLKNLHANNVIFYKLNPSPSILINMIEIEDLPDGIGDSGFLVIPENLDPKIKYNLSNILKNQLGIEVETGYAINGDVSPFDRKN